MRKDNFGRKNVKLPYKDKDHLFRKGFPCSNSRDKFSRHLPSYEYQWGPRQYRTEEFQCWIFSSSSCCFGYGHAFANIFGVLLPFQF